MTTDLRPTPVEDGTSAIYQNDIKSIHRNGIYSSYDGKNIYDDIFFDAKGIF
jgi:hypothetical protein